MRVRVMTGDLNTGAAILLETQVWSRLTGS